MEYSLEFRPKKEKKNFFGNIIMKCSLFITLIVSPDGDFGLLSLMKSPSHILRYLILKLDVFELNIMREWAKWMKEERVRGTEAVTSFGNSSTESEWSQRLDEKRVRDKREVVPLTIAREIRKREIELLSPYSKKVTSSPLLLALHQLKSKLNQNWRLIDDNWVSECI